MYIKPYKNKKTKDAPPVNKLVEEDKFCNDLLFNIGRDFKKNRRQFQETIAYYAAYLQTHPKDLEVFNSFLLRKYPNASVIPNLGRRLKKAVMEKRKKKEW